MQRLRDNPAARTRNSTASSTPKIPGLTPRSASIPPRMSLRRTSRQARGREIAVLREQGVNGQVEMAAAFDRAGFEAYDVHMSDLVAGRALARGFQRASPPAADSPTATCSAPARAGRRRSCSTRARATSSHAFFSRARQLRARRVQRLPDDEQSARADPGRRALAALREEPLRAVRGAARDGRGPAFSVALLRGNGGQPHARRHGSRRRPPSSATRRIRPAARRSSRCASSTTAARRPSSIR